ncbi:hypothetical protein JKP88DRAFT_288469 [Tribonema minus]|uniref:Methyltransferase FkbM domain-containing protein n=1 Tax=Tribonema minus TaxID=303371 RepID=A0A835Z6J4_9STRA|nr:hypothetical protein JKP88DRAFT_288469 [Tribonema minus]
MDACLLSGTNYGIQIRKLYEPHLYSGAKVLPLFEEHFGSSREGVCAISIEPNPRHTPRLEALETAYRAQGWNIAILTNTAAYDRHTTLEFAHTHKAWDTNASGDRLSNVGHLEGGTYTVQGIDLPRFVSSVIGHMQQHARRSQDVKYEPEAAATAARFVMKMDIEGAEWTVMPALLASGALCQLDLVFIEYHPGADAFGETPVGTAVREMLPSIVEAYPRCRASILELDDESYDGTGLPLPRSGTPGR